MADYRRRRRSLRNSTWVISLTCLVNIHDVPAFSSTFSLTTSSSRRGSSLTRKIAGGAIRGGVYSFHQPVDNEEPLGKWRICDGYTRRRSVLGGVWQLWCCAEVGSYQSSGDGNGTSDNVEETKLLRASSDALARPDLDRRKEDDRLGPRAEYSPHQVAFLVLQGLRHNDIPYPNHGCEVAIRFSSSSNPASRFAPGGMRTYLDDPSMPFYRILSEWDEIVEDSDLDVDDARERANQQTRVRRKEDEAWSTVAMDLVREDGCWLIERLWVDDESDLRGDGSRRTRLTLAELFDEDRLEVMSCRYADYDPMRLGGGADSSDSGGTLGWLEEYPNPSLSPKAVALTCIISLRQNDDGSTDGLDNDDSPAPGPRRPRNEGCERVIRFCSSTNVASTLTPAHFAKYLREPWYAILKEWDELAFHSEDVSDDGLTANLVVLLRPESEDEWTSVNWELVKCDDMWLTERIWVVDV